MIDKNYCMSSYLTFRFIADEKINFYQGLSHTNFKPYDGDKIPCKTADDVGKHTREILEKQIIPGKTAIFLSGGNDSAVLASYLPKGTIAYTFKCIAPGAIDETIQAKKYADAYGLDHRIIEMYWDDFEKFTPEILKYRQVPVHSIEIMLHKAMLQAKKDGIKAIVTGVATDLVFGGMDKMLSKDWTFDEWVKRYTFVPPEKILKNPVSMLHIYEKYRLEDNKIDFIKFINEVFGIEADTSYMHAFNMENIIHLDPHAYLVMAEPLDLNRIRNGEPKYLIKELFKKRYPHIPVPDKIPMPRAMDQWLKDWDGPTRKEFLPNCVKDLTGDQKWMVYCLEKYLNIFDDHKDN